jgi:hypothetical protein
MEFVMGGKCVNEQCRRDLDQAPDYTVVNFDGDAACSKACFEAYKRQMDYFCRHVLSSDEEFAKWVQTGKKWKR